MSDIDEDDVIGPVWHEYKVIVEFHNLPSCTYYAVHIESEEGEDLGSAEAATVADAAHIAFFRHVGDFDN